MKNVTELIKLAFENALSLVETSDTDQFWGEELFDEALEVSSGEYLRRLDAAKERVEVFLAKEIARRTPKIAKRNPFHLTSQE